MVGGVDCRCGDGVMNGTMGEPALFGGTKSYKTMGFGKSEQNDKVGDAVRQRGRRETGREGGKEVIVIQSRRKSRYERAVKLTKIVSLLL